MDARQRQFYLEDLVGSRIVDAGNRHIGHVVDVQVSPRPEFRVMGLLYGRETWLFRLHVMESFMRRLGTRGTVHIIPWHAVDRFEHFTVTLKSNWENEDVTPTQIRP